MLYPALVKASSVTDTAMRHYQIQTPDGLVSLPSVTTILDVTMPLERRSQLEQAKAKDPYKFYRSMEEGRKRGDWLHRYAATRLRGGRLGHGPYGKWLRHVDPLLSELLEHRTHGETLWVEQECWSLRHRYAGTFDLCCEWPDLGWVLADFKTSMFKVWPDALHDGLLQAAAYRLAWGEQHPLLLPDAIAVVYVLPSGLHTTVVDDSMQLERLTDEWIRRRRRFGERLGMADE